MKTGRNGFGVIFNEIINILSISFKPSCFVLIKQNFIQQIKKKHCFIKDDLDHHISIMLLHGLTQVSIEGTSITCFKCDVFKGTMVWVTISNKDSETLETFKLKRTMYCIRANRMMAFYQNLRIFGFALWSFLAHFEL